MTRRSLTIKEENDKKIQNIRAMFLYSNIDIDYTTMVNILIELGDMILISKNNIEDVSNIVRKYADIDIKIDDLKYILENFQNKMK